jgi:hypothetical protein
MEFNMFTIFIFLFAGTASVLAYGLWTLPTWMWYLGWGMFYLFGVFFGGRFYILLTSSEGPRGFAHAYCWLVGGFLIWINGVLWWSRNRHRSGNKKEAGKGK